LDIGRLVSGPPYIGDAEVGTLTYCTPSRKPNLPGSTLGALREMPPAQPLLVLLRAPESSWELLDACHEIRSTLGAFWRCAPAPLLMGALECSRVNPESKSNFHTMCM